ncbi:MAG: hypothetical protein MUC88_03700 [Planctomycetes bacterium]|jgi:hypothetical protein|nr:hypothetical protein [Planctomycetota bacterium]
MNRKGMMGVIIGLSLLVGTLPAADILLNEYNAVDDIEFLGGGDSAADENGGRAADSFFGRIPGNGGDWFELIVIKDHLDLRGWQLDTFVDGKLDKTLTLTAQSLWQDLRAGTIITVAQDVPGDVSYDPAAGDWWIQVQANDDADGKYISAESFAVNNKNWQLRIRNIAGGIAFGPAGEGVAPGAKVGGTEVFFLKEDPSASITPNSPDYDTSKRFSTFGAPNRWGTQDVNDLRPVITPKTGSLTVLSPNGGEALTAGKVHTIRWQSTGVAETVLVEFSPDGGFSWSPVYPPNVGNTGQYRWLVPLVDSNQALIRVSSVNRPGLGDISDKVFTTVASTVAADLVRDGALDFSNLAFLAATWLN